MPQEIDWNLVEAVQDLAKSLPSTHCDSKVGERIRQRRNELGLSQRQLCFPGCSYAFLSRVELGGRRPSLSLLLKLSLLLDVSPRYLALGEGLKRLNTQQTIDLMLLLGTPREAVSELLIKAQQVRLLSAR